MRLFLTTIVANNEIMAGVHLLDVHAAQLAQMVKPGQYCMLRCCDHAASDPFLRRPFFIHESEPERDLLRFLVFARGRASRWLARLQAGEELDILAPLGRAWEIRPQVRNLLLIGEAPVLSSVISQVRPALEEELAVTLVEYSQSGQSYPAALLSPEVEYQVFSGTSEQFTEQLRDYLTWADALCCSVLPTTLRALIAADVRWRGKHFAQAALLKTLACGSGACFACAIETRQGMRLICRDGPTFAVSELIEI